MEREHYWLLANALATQPDTEVKYGLVLELCAILKPHNPKFDADKFIDAAEFKQSTNSPLRFATAP